MIHRESVARIFPAAHFTIRRMEIYEVFLCDGASRHAAGDRGLMRAGVRRAELVAIVADERRYPERSGRVRLLMDAGHLCASWCPDAPTSGGFKALVPAERLPEVWPWVEAEFLADLDRLAL
jgi:hypothetical protein